MSDQKDLGWPPGRLTEGPNLPKVYPVKDQFPESEFDPTLAAARAGSEWAWTNLYRWLGPSLLRFLRARGVPDADDVLGDTFVRIVRGLPEFQGDAASFKAWTFTIARNIVVDRARSASRKPAEAVSESVLVEVGSRGDSEQEALEALSEGEIRLVIESLTPDQRDVILLRFFGQLTAAEVGQVLGKSTGAIKTLQVRALAQIRRSLSREAVSR